MPAHRSHWEFCSPRRTAHLGKCSHNTLMEDGGHGLDDTHKCLLKTRMQNDVYASMSTWRAVSSDASQGSIFHH